VPRPHGSGPDPPDLFDPNHGCEAREVDNPAASLLDSGPDRHRPLARWAVSPV